MRIPIREQLAGLIVLAAGIGLAVISIATWYTNHNFVLSIRSTRLSLVASLKAAQLTSNLAIYQNSADFTSSRVIMQSALGRYNDQGNNSASNWVAAQADMVAAIGGSSAGGLGQSLLLQMQIFGKNASGPNGPYSVINATGPNIGTIKLPYQAPNGSDVYLADTDYGYPPALYPNLTYSSFLANSTYWQQAANYQGQVLTAPNGTLLLGPWPVNASVSLMSLTIPIINNTSAVDVLGWLTVVCDARLIGDVISSTEGLGQTGETLILGPLNTTNHFVNGVLYDSSGGVTANPADVDVHYTWPLPAADINRHPSAGATSAPAFPLTKYPALVQAYMQNQNASANAGSNLATTNEIGRQVSVGFALLDTQLCDWVVLVEQDRSEVWEPITHLRKVLLACVFGTLGVIILIAWPLAHFASAPIRRLREATRKTVMPVGYAESNYSRGSFDTDNGHGADDHHGAAMARKEGFFGAITGWNNRRLQHKANRKEEQRHHQFRIPGKVRDRHHIIEDELSDLTRTYNEMSDELMMQYERLEDKVKVRTAELELSKKAAEAANESKTLFIANISHELKTPLNGILGMCAVCMQEDDPVKLKRSLGIIYKSGDLLLALLTDLLTFSKNQVGQQLALDEREFRLRDVSSQVLAIFDKQAKDGQIDLKVDFQGTEFDALNASGDEHRKDHGPFGTGRVKDMILWGDQHRILQVVINLVSNSLKFTPHGGSVVLTIRCVGESPDVNSRKSSLQSKTSKFSSRHKGSSDASLALPNEKRTNVATANEINPLSDRANALASIMASERSPSPPPGKKLIFEFEVKDTGPGIAEYDQQRIFEPFVQGDLGLNKKFGGTGLGLSICSQLAGLMHGTIGLESEVGQGSTFMMRIPLRHLLSRTDSSASSMVGGNVTALDSGRSPGRRGRLDRAGSSTSVKSVQSIETSSPQPPATAQLSYQQDVQPRLVGLSHPFFTTNPTMDSPETQSAAIEKITADAKGTGKIRVLVAEDNKVNQEVVLRMLKLEDIYDVTVAKDGQEALDLVKASMDAGQPSFNLIFMDVQMPNLDGLQSTRLIRDLGYQAPIVALTAFSEESNVKDCLDSGMNYFLSKPIRRPALKKVLKEYCAPIQEVDEDASPGHDSSSKGASKGALKSASKTSTAGKGKSGPSVVVSETPVSDAMEGQQNAPSNV